jgi:hypothetical protein
MCWIMFLVYLESYWWGGVHGLGSMTFGLAVQKFLNIEWLECAFGVLGKISMNKFNGIYLLRFGFKMWEILIFKWFSTTENSNKFPKTKFWKEKSVEDVVTLGLMAHATLM